MAGVKVNVGRPVRQLAVGGYSTCALLESGAVRCWGRNGSGLLGYDRQDDVGNDEEPASAGDLPLF